LTSSGFARDSAGMKGRSFVLVAVATALIAACAAQPTRRDKLLKRAAFDLNCGKDELTVSKLDDRTRGVRGCGRQATYVETCDRVGYNCTWVMNNQASVGDDD
jgi:hypothetical protein